MAKALITGCCGFIGSHLTDKLVSLGWKVTGVDNLRTGKLENLNKNITFHNRDIGKQCYLREYNENYDFIFHLAAAPSVPESVSNPIETHNININETLILLETFKNHCGRFIFTSSSAVYGNNLSLPLKTSYSRSPQSPYALHKAIGEDYCKLYSELYKLDTVCLRYFNVFGPRQNGKGAYANAVSAWLYAIKNNLPLRSDGDGTQSRDLVFVHDVVEANILSAESSISFKGDCLNVGSGKSYTNKEILKILKDRFGDLNVERAPERLGDVKHTLADIEETYNLIGYEPKFSLEDGIDAMMDSF